MSAVRLAGIVVGIVVLALMFRQFRAGRARRLDFALSSLAALAVVIVSAEPTVVGVLRDILALEPRQFSRIIVLLIGGVAFLWFGLLQLQGRVTVLTDQFDRLVRVLAVYQFQETYPDVERLAPILVIMPAYDEAENIAGVLDQIPNMACDRKIDVLVIDDGSTDETPQIARLHGAFVIKTPMNRGGGAALRAGFDLAKAFGSSIVVTIDADGQHLPGEMECLVAPLVRDDADIVIGSRILGRREQDSAVRFIGIHVFNLVIRMLSDVRLTDCSSGYRAIKTACFDVLVLRQNQYHTSELIIDASKRGLRIVEAPITVRRRQSGESKKGRNWHYGVSFARTILRTWWR